MLTVFFIELLNTQELDFKLQCSHLINQNEPIIQNNHCTVGGVDTLGLQMRSLSIAHRLVCNFDQSTDLIQALLALKSHYEFCIMPTGSSCPCSLFILKNKGVMRGKKKKLNTVALL